MIEATADGVSFSSLGLGLIKHDIPVLPDTRDYNVQIDGKDGEIDFGSVYAARMFNLECVVMASDPTTDYQAKVAAIASVFNAKKGDIIFTFSDLPTRRYLARYAGSIPIEKIIFDGNITIPLKMHNPFPESLRDTKVIEYGQGFEYGQGYEYSSFSIQVTASSQTIPIENMGSVEVTPLIRITGAFINLNLSDGSKSFTFTGTNTSSDILEINCDKFTVKKNNVNAYGQSNGVFFLLKPGVTTMTFSATSLNFKAEFIFRHKFLY